MLMEQNNAKTVDLFGPFDGRSQHLKTISVRIVLRVDRNRVIPIDLRPAFDTGDDGRFPADGGHLFDGTREPRTDYTLVDEAVAFLQLSFGIPLSHPGGSTCTAGGTVDSLVAVEDRVTRSGFGVDGLAGPEDMRAAMDGRVFGMDESMGFVDPAPHHPAPADQLIGGKVVELAEVLLRIN